MDSHRWTLLQRLFEQALALPPEERPALLAAGCAGDEALAAELAELLAAEVTPREDLVTQVLAEAAERWMDQGRRELIGRRLGAWRVTSHLADGGMGAVYRAERADGQYEQEAAIKLINPALVSPSMRARLESERQILARLSHPLIARLLDGGRTDDGAPYLVMEYVDGEPIDLWCEHHALDTRARLALFVQVCRVVDHAHRNLVVHRDIKPSNILVDTSGAPRLLDFGIARLLDQGGATASGERLLTPDRASPEQITGAGITTATDVYALGVLLYDLLAGSLPHAASSDQPAALARAILEDAPARPSSAVRTGSSRRLAAARRRGAALTPAQRARELAGDLDNIVLVALRKEPERRYASAGALADDVECHLAHRPVAARADTWWYRGAKFLRRHPVAVPATVLALLMAAGVGAAFTWRLADERDRALAAERSARRTADYTASLLGSTDAEALRKREVSVLELLQRAEQRVTDDLAGDAAAASRLRRAIGSAYYSWGDYTAAERVLRQALEAQRRLAPGPDADTADTLSLIANVTHDLGRLEESLQWTREAESMWQQVGTPAQKATALSDLALALNGLRRRDEAEPVFRAALAQQRLAQPGDHADTAWTLNNLAWCLHAMGRLAEAQPLYDEALAMQRRLKLSDAEIGQTLNNLAGLYGDLGDIERAEAGFREVLAMVERFYGRGGHAAVARAHSALGVIEIERGLWDEALADTREALDVNLKLLGERHRWTAITMQTHATALLGSGRIGEAQALFERSLAVRRAVLPPGHADLVTSYYGLARVALQRDQPARAEQSLRHALAIIDALDSPDRVQRDRVEWLLGRAIALQGRREEGRRFAELALERRRREMPADHPRRLFAEAGIGLPPFVEQPGQAAAALAGTTLDLLRRRLGVQAPLVRDLERQLTPKPRR